MEQERKKPRKKPPVKLVAWGNNYPAAKRAFAEKALELRLFGEGVDPGLKDGMLLFDISIEWFFDLLKEKQKIGKIITPDQLDKILSLPEEPEFPLRLREFDHFFPSVTAFIEICHKHGLSCRLCEYQPAVFNFHSKRKEVYVTIFKAGDFHVYYNLSTQLTNHNYYHYFHLGQISKDIPGKLVPGDKIEIVCDGTERSWRVTKIL